MKRTGSDVSLFRNSIPLIDELLNNASQFELLLALFFGFSSSVIVSSLIFLGCFASFGCLDFAASELFLRFDGLLDFLSAAGFIESGQEPTVSLSG